MSHRVGRPQGLVRRRLEAAIEAGVSGTYQALAAACGVAPRDARATLKEIHRARRRHQADRFDPLAYVSQAWR